ncbi:hypothetical protein F4820DRAFT_213794 [Hypoxylon rubiginosum]|uniref:Uncharacterized protein n=1 Tax=Hypoxylon rubiginosum TaxID=110542 RepID=A0ACB9Z8F0_9PEZI|nr:hypothetical protein F4820DRAFT_213794 [Hypoxylon rubiginosum]
MNKIPPEILLNIVDGLDAPLARYASVSRAFRQVIEARTFANIQLTSTEQSLTKFDAIFSNTRRRYFVRELEYKVELPDISKKRFKKLQSNREAAENNRVYTVAVSALFTRLQKWTDATEDLEKAPSFRLTISSSSPKDSYRPESPHQHEHDPAWEVRNSFKYIEFNELEVLPPLLCVNEFDHSGRSLHPNVMAVINKALPRMKSLLWELFTAPRRLEALRADLRASMASVLADTEFSNLEALDIYYEDTDPLNQDWEPENLLDANGDDPLSLAVNRISRLPKLRLLELRGTHILSPAVFDVDGENRDAWRFLEYLYLDVSKTTPGGGWYFTGDREKTMTSDERIESDSEASVAAFDSDDSDASDFLPDFRWRKLDGDIPWVDFRLHPDPITLNPFLIAMARAIVRMPALKRFACGFTDAADIYYYGPGVEKSGPMTIDKSNFFDSALSHGRWIMDFETEIPFNDEDPLFSDWVLPPELTETLEAAGHRIFLTRGYRHVHRCQPGC